MSSTNVTQASSRKKATVFISYAREDRAFVTDMRAKLAALDIEPRGDWQLQPGVRYQEELHAAIVACDSFLFVITRASVVSEPCRLEIDFAAAQNKRLSPVVREDVPDEAIHAALRPIQYTFMRETDDEAEAFSQLEKGIKSDLPWVKAHSYWLERAGAWSERGRNRSSLLRGTDLQDAERWLATATSDITKDPRPTPLQTEYLAASRNSEKKSQRILLGSVSSGLVIALVLLVFAVIQYRVAVREKANAESSATVARDAEARAKEALKNETTQRELAQAALEREQNALKSETAAKKKAIDAAEAEREARAAEVVARKNAEKATTEALHNLSQAYVEKADRALQDKDVGGGQLLLAHALTLDDRRETREKLWEARSQGTRLRWTSDYRPGGAAVALTRDGSRVVLGCADYNIRIWNTANGQVVHVLRGHTGYITTVAISPSERLLASGGRDHSVRLWNVKTGEETRVLSGHDDDVLSVAFSKDGSKLVSVGSDNALRVWDIAQGKLLSHTRLSVTPLKVAALARDGSLLAYFAGEEPTVRLVDVKTGKELKVFEGYKGTVENISFSPDVTRLAAQDTEGTLKVWDLRKPSFPFITDTKVEHTSHLTFSPDGNALALYHSFGRDTYLSVWNFEKDRELHKFATDTSLTAIGFSADGKWIAAGGDMLRLWRLDLNREVNPISGHGHAVLDLAYSPDGRFIASSGLDNTVRVWDANMGQELRVFAVPDSRSVVFSPDGTMLAANDTGGKVYLWDVESGTRLAFFDDGKPHSVFGRGGLSFSPSGDALYEAVDDEQFLSWSIEPRKEPVFPEGRTASGHDYVFSPDGMSYVRCFQKSVKLVNLVTHQEIINKEQEDYTSSAAFSADGSLLAVANQSGTIRLFSTDDGREVRALRTPSLRFNDISFSQDGKRLVTSGYGEFKVWDVETGTELFNISSARTSKVWNEGLAFSPDGRYVAVGSDDSAVRVWSVEYSPELKLLRGHSNYIRNLVYSADGQFLLSEGFDEKVRLWNMADPANPHLVAARDGVKAGSLSPDGKLMALATDPQTVEIVDVASGDSFQIQIDKGKVNELAFSEDGLLATGSQVSDDGSGTRREYQISIWNVADRKKVVGFVEDQGWIECLAFGPKDSNLLATGGSQGIGLRNRMTGELVGRPKGHAGTVTGVAFSRDGKRLASSSRDGTVRLWNVENSKELLTFYGHTDWVEAVTFAADDKILTSIGTDLTVRFWDTQSGRELFKLSTPVNKGAPAGSWVRRIVYNSQQQTIAASIGDFSVHIWDLNEVIRFFHATPVKLFEESQQQTGLKLSKLQVTN